jgi:feruloyl esterase
MMLLRRLLAAGCGIAALVGGSAAAAAGTPCDKLTAMTIPDVTITAAGLSPAGGFKAEGLKGDVPAFCRVQGIARPTPRSEIKFEVWVPPQGAWNGKFQGVGNGGYQGNIPYDAMAVALRRGYAVAATDTGHTGDDLSFGRGEPEKVTDWAYRAIHVTAQVGKLVVRSNAGRLPDYSYFVGCSTGGHQALSEAQRFPGDYDGIVAGDPGYDRVRQTAAYLYNWLALHDAQGQPLVSNKDLQFVTRSVIAACDAKDGLKDGVIDDPRRCGFDPGTLQCKPGQTTECLTPVQVGALRKVYRGLHNPRTGEEIFPGWSPGSEGFGDSPAMGWGAYLLNPKQPMRSEVYKHLVFEDPAWDYRSFDFDRDVAYADGKISNMAAVDTNLSAFRDRGGKLVMYTGWADPVAAPMDVLKYYEGVVRTMGGQAKTDPFYRFFMAPGMGHCGNGPGPNTFDALGALENWVEKGRAPQTLLASTVVDGKVTRTRPLCPYPKVARWNGKGRPEDAASFACVAPPAASKGRS